MKHISVFFIYILFLLNIPETKYDFKLKCALNSSCTIRFIFTYPIF